MTPSNQEILSQGGGYGVPPGGAPPPGPPPGGYGPPAGGPPPGGSGGPPLGPPPGGYGGPPPGGAPPGYGGPPPGYPGYPPPGGPSHGGAQPGPAADAKKQATTWLIVSIVSFFFCGGVNCFGLIGAVLCFLAMQAADQNNVPDAESKLKWGKITTIAGGAFALVSVMIAVIYYVVVIAATFASV